MIMPKIASGVGPNKRPWINRLLPARLALHELPSPIIVAVKIQSASGSSIRQSTVFQAETE
jgi:hypothetical protein